MRTAINAVPYMPAIKIGLQMKRRFWEEDEAIYGGVTYTDLPIRQIGYPCSDYGSSGKGVLLGAYAISNTYAFEFGALPPAERIRKALEWGKAIHPQYDTEYENGIAVSWQRNPSTLGCFGYWSPDARKQYYQDLCAIEGRLVLAGEHASYIPAWQEGAILSAVHAVRSDCTIAFLARVRVGKRHALFGCNLRTARRRNAGVRSGRGQQSFRSSEAIWPHGGRGTVSQYLSGLPYGGRGGHARGRGELWGRL